ncbi:MAG: 5-formyltetrahydrofolate cyclo-ligase [bacterium]
MPQDKAAMRAGISAAVAALPPARRALEEEVVQAAIQDTPAWRQATTVALYAAKAPEFSVVALTLAAWRDGKRTLFPRVAGPRKLEFCPVAAWHEFQTGAFGLREPAAGPGVSLSDIDLCIVPGVAFDEGRRRLGRGSGFYDAVIPALATSWGVGFDCQLVTAVPWEAHDATVSDVWTCRRKRLLDS